MRPGRAFAIVLRQLYLIRGSLSRVFPLFVWVALDVVLWGYITKYLNSVTHTGSGAGLDFVPALLGGVLLWDFLTRVMQGVTMAFFEDVWSRNFLNIFATPLSIPEYVGGLVLSSIGTSAVGLVVMGVVAVAVFGLSLLSLGALLVPLLLLLFLFGIALGIVGAAVVLRLGPSAEWFVWPIPAVISPFVGVFYPVATLPGWMQAVSRALPPSYVFEALRAHVHGGSVPLGALAWGGALSLVYLLLACAFFTRIFRHAVRTGLIARYSAESVS
ncbi:ABC transporter permease [Aggregicoccus sp. 17bor-14]|uniref:ABC transporter permease n=1 Tax=Myxococcaceae TaxID=31 RepID=UPI00129C4892|nr:MULTISPECIES: ABC transporter permease [Myxococcaceae]MBF5045607.1 ABC transporter permease [Simulacricoccus sp. 17bor-14]MRI91344.1 ABC transporter permease [Aggregicoccus sp. 17bor-14]